jgi:hypothetical protein
VTASINCPVIRTRVPALRTDPSSPDYAPGLADIAQYVDSV